MRNAKTIVVVLALCAAGAGGGVAAAAAKPRADGPLARLSAPLRPKTAQGTGRGPRANGAAVVGTPGHDSAHGARSQPAVADGSRGHPKGRNPQDLGRNNPSATSKTSMIVASAPTTVFLPSDYWY